MDSDYFKAIIEPLKKGRRKYNINYSDYGNIKSLIHILRKYYLLDKSLCEWTLRMSIH
jgi:hypothetical protein